MQRHQSSFTQLGCFFSAATILEAKLQIARCVGSCRFVLCAFKNAASQGLELVCWGFPLWKAVCWCMRYIYNIMSPEFVGSVGCHVILKCFHSGTFCYFHSFSFHGWYVLRAALHCCLSVFRKKANNKRNFCGYILGYMEAQFLNKRSRFMP